MDIELQLESGVLNNKQMTWDIYFLVFGSLLIINLIYLVYLKIDQIKKANKLSERLNRK
jgi:hypothetical protein